MKISYNWLRWYIPDVPAAEKLADIITYHLAEVESMETREDGDSILDIKILPNRAHDLLSHQGMAREIASLLSLSYVDPTPKYKIPESKSTQLKIDIESEKCRRYSGRIIRNVKVGPSPEWVVKHLESIGQRSINNMVDAANLVMYDSGQPTHVFDLDKIEAKLIIRQAKEGEEITTLDGKNCKLRQTDMVIADSAKTLAIAGIKGGRAAEVGNGTKNIILEVANFEPISVRKTAQFLNIFTDARKRFENDLSPELVSYAMTELSALIFEMCPEAVFEDVVDLYPKKPQVGKLSFENGKISKILGMEIKTEDTKEILKRYDIKHQEQDGKFEIVVPPMRLDLAIEEDMAEEIGRVLGYDKLKGDVRRVDFQPKQNETYGKIAWARNKLASEGYSEVMNSSFRDKGELSVLASASDKNFLRSNLSDGLKESLKLNQANMLLLETKDKDGIKIFEIGTVFKKSGEVMNVAYGDKKEIKEMSLEEFVTVSPEFNSESTNNFPGKIFFSRPDRTTQRFSMWSLFPFIARDIAVWVDDGVKSEEVANVIKENAGNLLVRGPKLFDEFKKDGKISYAFRMVFQSYERTLTDNEVNEIMENMNAKILEKGWQVR